MHNIKRKKEQGLAVLVSILLLMIVSVMGLIASSKGTFVQKLSAVNARNNELAVAAEVAMRDAISDIQYSKVAIGTSGSGQQTNSNGWLEKVWDPKDLAQVFGQNNGRTNFTDFTDAGWGDANIQVNNRITSRGSIVTRTIIEEIAKTSSSGGGGGAASYASQYLVTVKAYATVPNSTVEKEKYIIQAVIGREFQAKVPKKTN